MENLLKDPICLITPPSVFLLDERVFVNLGILKIAAVLEEAGYELEMLDLSGISNYVAAVHDHLESSTCTTFGITATTPQIPQVMAIIREIRETVPGAKIILGGPHVTLIHTAAQKEERRGIAGRASKAFNALKENFDVLVSGDGEKAVFEALREDAPKLVDANDLHSPLFLSREEFTASPFPARHLIDLQSYRYNIDGVPATSIVAQLGCPFDCGFCGGRESPCLRMVRIRSTSNIIEEIESIYRTYGYTGFMFYDDELNVNPRLMELLDGLIAMQVRLGVRFNLRGFVKSELFNEAQAKAMLQAGFRWILSGFESGSPQTLVNMNKRATREDNTRCVEIAHKYGLKVKALMSIGHPGESKETIAATRDWLLEARPDDFDVTIISPYPGTGYYDRSVPVIDKKGTWVYTVPKTGDRLYSTEVDYASTSVFYKGDPNDGYKAFTYTDHLSSEEMLKLRNALEHEIREALNIPYNAAGTGIEYDHSMGQTGDLPDSILKATQSSQATMVA